MPKRKEFIMERNAAQQKCSDAFSNLQEQEKLLIESPTGSGKTFIDILSAIKYSKKNDTPVIISTNTNRNASEIIKTFKQNAKSLGVSEEDIILEIGKSNYIDIERLHVAIKDNPKLYPEISMESLKEKYTQSVSPLLFLNNVLMEDFLSSYGFDLTASDQFSTFFQDDDNTLCPKTLSHIIGLLNEKKIIVTNHAYLIILFRFYGNRNNQNINQNERELLLSTPIIMDEFHALYDAAKGIFSNRFSLFRLKYSIAALLDIEGHNLTKISKKKLKTILLEISKVEKEVSSSSSEFKMQNLLAEFKIKIGGATKLHQLATSINQSNLETAEGEKYARFTSTELKELAIINLHRTMGVQIHLSPRGFPSVEANNGIPSYMLRKLFWAKQTGAFMGLSGTLRTEDADTFAAYQWVMERVGLFVTNQDEEKQILKKNTTLDEVTKKSILLENQKLNNSIKNIKTIKNTSLFERSNYIYTVVTDENMKIHRMSGKKDEDEEAKTVWRNSISTFISSTMRYNSLVLVVGYEDAKALAKNIAASRKNISVHYAIEGKSIVQTVSEYIKDIDAGKTCCLVGTDQYYTGLDLPGKYLVELFIAKIPFQSPNGKVGKKIYKYLTHTKSESYQKETLLKFLQGKGRPIRGFEDKAILYILDGRILDNRRAIYRKFLTNSAIEQDFSTVLRMRDKFFQDSGALNNSNIYTFFYTIFGNIGIESIIKELKILKKDRVIIDNIIEKLLNNGLSTKGYSIESLKSKSYSIWSFLLKIGIEGYKKDTGENIEEIIIENALFGKENISSFSEAFFRKEGSELEKLNNFYDYLEI